MKKLIFIILILPLCSISCAATIGSRGTYVDVIPPLPVTVVMAGPYYFLDAYYPYYYYYYNSCYYYYYCNRWYYSRYRHPKHTCWKPLPSQHYPRYVKYKSHNYEYKHKKHKKLYRYNYKNKHNDHKREHRKHASEHLANKKQKYHEKN